MSGTNTRLTPLAARKQLLLVESEVNRAQLSNECLALKNQAKALARKAHSVVDSVNSTIAVVHDAITTMRGALTNFQNNKSSLISTVINAARLGSSLWTAFRQRFH